MYGLSFLENLFNFNSEKRSEKVMSKLGVFVRDAQHDEKVIASCIRFHQDIKSETKIVAAKRNTACNGLEVLFNCESGISEFLKKKYLSDSDGFYTIHSLDTVLSLHNAFPNDEDEFKRWVRSRIENLSSVQVLNITKVPFSKSYPEIGIGKWLIYLDVPEVEELDVFRKMGLPDNMTLEYPDNGERYRVTFYCRLCQQDEHTQFRCLEGISDEIRSSIHPNTSRSISERSVGPVKSEKPKAGMAPKATVSNASTSGSHIRTPNKKNTTSKNEKSKSTKYSPGKTPSGFRIRDLAEERAEPTPDLAVLETIETFERRIGTEEALNYFSNLQECRIKKEIVEKTSSPFSSTTKRPVEHDTKSSKMSSVKKPCTHTDSYKDEPNFSEVRRTSASSTTTDKDSIEILYEVPNRQGYSQNPPDNSPVVTTSHQLPVDPPTTEEDSNPAPVVRPRKKASPMLPVVIPPDIRAIAAAVPDPVLPVELLEAFFSHVKKKSRPAEFARMYTPDVDGLFEQLKEISRRYYMRPVVGSNDDLKFMKMLSNVVLRFYKGPPKRKSGIKEEV